MMRKSITVLATSLMLASTTIATTAHAASISNGAACSKVGAKATVKVKGVSVAYICKSNPTESFKSVSWIQQRCIQEFSMYQNGIDSITSARPVYSALSEPDRTKALSQLDASQATLDQLRAKMKQNHCKKGA
jgi:hypothetical protein